MAVMIQGHRHIGAGRGDPQRWQEKKYKMKKRVRPCGLLSCSFPQRGDVAGGSSPPPPELRLHPARAQRASSLCSPTPLPPLPSPSLRFQCNFQLTSMSIEQVGQPGCWPITGNHSAPQLSSQGEGGRGGANVREQTPSSQAEKGLGAGNAAAPGRGRV